MSGWMMKPGSRNQGKAVPPSTPSPPPKIYLTVLLALLWGQVFTQQCEGLTTCCCMVATPPHTHCCQESVAGGDFPASLLLLGTSVIPKAKPCVIIGCLSAQCRMASVLWDCVGERLRNGQCPAQGMSWPVQLLHRHWKQSLSFWKQALDGTDVLDWAPVQNSRN